MATTEDIPRDPGEWRPTHHFTERFRNRGDGPNRHLDAEIVRRCIEDGDIIRESNGQIRFRATVAGVTYRLVADPGNRMIQTAYPVSMNAKEARESGRWSSVQLGDIRRFINTNPNR